MKKTVGILVMCGLLTFCSSDFWSVFGSTMMGIPMGGMYGAPAYSGGSSYSSGSSVSSTSTRSSTRSSSTSSSGRMCRLCVGTGKCKTCNGSGIARDEQFGTGKTYKCPNCNGNGRCFSCNGTGRH